MITALQDVYYNVADMERAVRFYRDVLGLKVVDSSPYWTTLDAGGMRFGLHATEGGAVPAIPRDSHGAHAGATVTFRVADVRKAGMRLQGEGVKLLSDITEKPWGTMLVFEDPDGNVLKLMQPPGK